MAFQRSLFLSLFLFANFFTHVFSVEPEQPISLKVSVPFNRTLFPPDFLFGASSSAYQIEGAWNEDGKGPSIWDNFTHERPDKILDKSNGDVAIDFYHRYKEDIKLAKDAGLDSFRISIAWTRILPQGKLSKGINRAGIDFYNRVINEMIAQGIKPFVTLFHWDTPQALEDEYLGFLSHKIVDDYLDYVDICFKYFGDRVKLWTTINEAHTYSITGYDYGLFAPGRCSDWRNSCSAGNSATEPYIVGHNMLLAHAAAVKLYRQKYQAKQKGEIGMIFGSKWFVPYSEKQEDVQAARRALDFELGWFLNPLVYGDYPEVMKKLVGKRLPKFTSKEKKLLKGSFDFVGLNHYTSYYAAHLSIPPEHISASTDCHVSQTFERDGQWIGPPTGYFIFFVVPWGFEKILLHIKHHYKNPVIYVTENGYGESHINKAKEGVNDTDRIDLYKSYISAMHKAYEQGVKVKAFYAWSLQDNFEWFQGYTIRFGINFIDYKNNLKRYPKKSAHWFKEFLLKQSSRDYQLLL